MNSLTSRQLVAIAVGLLLFACLFFINRKAPPIPSTDNPQSSGHAGKVKDFQEVLKESESSISKPDKELMDRLLNVLNTSPDSLHPILLFRISTVLDSIGQPLAASFYMEELAKMDKSPAIWYKAGNRYLDISDLVETADKEALLSKAQDCFNSALKIDSTNQDAKVGLGSCIVERANNPMMGIKMITEVVTRDSNNKAAQIALGRFSIKSAQYARAVYRFNRVMDIDHSFYEGYLYLAQAYEGLGNKKEAIVNLKKYRNFAPDSTIKSQIDKHISEDLKGDTIN